MQNSMSEITIVNASEIKGYRLYRSVSSQRLFNVVAYNETEDVLFVVESDLDFDTAIDLVEKMNKELGE